MNEENTPKQLLLEAIDYSEKEQSGLHYPSILVLHSLLHEFYQTIEERIQALEDICAHHNEYLKDVEMDQGKKAGVFLECQSLIHYSKIIQDLLTNKSIQSIFDANKDTIPIPLLEQHIYLSKLPELDLYCHHFIAFTEGYCFYAKQPTKVPTTSMAILQCKNFLGKLYSEDIMDFCRHLFCGEATRLHEIGYLKEHECLGIHNFDVAFRNHCFDVYIDIKKQEIAEEMNADNDRLYPPTVIDYLNQLLEESEYVVNREMQFEQFRGSYAYDQQYYAGRPDVLKMAGYFVAYLQDKINKLKSTMNTMPTHVCHDSAPFADQNPTINLNDISPEVLVSLLKKIQHKEDTSVTTGHHNEKNIFSHITQICRDEGKVQQVESELVAACKGTASALCKTIRTNTCLGYLDLNNQCQSSFVYREIESYFGKLPYSERNFRGYWNNTK